ncbi:MAG: hypothetical protein FWG94_06005 [Oscillospiraceae bacterium]|nr:hypothetical protein [Oscillospiraceae bacterium]
MALTKEDLQAIQGLLQPIHNRLDKVDSRLDKMDSRLDKVEQGQKDLTENLIAFGKTLDSFEESIETVRLSQMNVEMILTPKIKAAEDGYTNVREKNQEQDLRLTVLENKAENHGDRILAIEYALKAE